MTLTTVLVLTALFFLAAALYSAVGHAGASGYLAAMALAGVAPVVMRPTALTMNILVALIASARFLQTGSFSWRTFWPFALTSIPAAYLGGSLTLSAAIYGAIVGAILVYAALRLFQTASHAEEEVRTVPVVPALGAGVLIGALSGVTGVGGGIFLTPLMLLRRWATPRTAAGVSAVFILVNSVAGLAGRAVSLQHLPQALPLFLAAVAAGGWIGSTWGARRAAPQRIRQTLAVVLLVAAAKMIASAFTA